MKTFFLLILLLTGFLTQIETYGQAVKETPYYPMLNWDTSPYKSYRFTRTDKEWMNFRLLFPNGYDSTAADGNEYPLIIMLHGGGESARMEWNNSTKSNTPYPEGDPRIDNNDHHLLFGGKEHLEAVQKNRFPGFVLFPQNFYSIWVNEKGGAETEVYQDMEKALDLIAYLIQELKIDPNRIYLHGLSKGGVGAWYAAYSRPDLFAAVLPMSAPGDPAMAEALTSVPLWVFQGELDNNPSPAKTNTTIAAVREAGGSVRYTEYEDRGHNTWNLAYNEPDFFEWMLKQSKDETPPPNLSPAVDAGENKTITLPANTIQFTATASDPDGSIVSFSWEKVEGPDVNLNGRHTHTLEVSGLEKGSYLFLITVRDNEGATASDQVKLTVKEEKEAEDEEDETEEGGDQENEEEDDENENGEEDGQDQLPMVIAGKDTTLLLPLETFSLKGKTIDNGHEIVEVKWEKLKGPTITIIGEDKPEAVLTNLQEGEYIFRFIAVNSEGITVTDEVKIIMQKEGSKPLSIKEEEFVAETPVDIKISAFPNPFQHQIQIKISAKTAQTFLITLFDSKGAIVHSGKFSTNPKGNKLYTIEFPNIFEEKAHYYLQVWSKENKFRKGFVVIKE